MKLLRLISAGNEYYQARQISLSIQEMMKYLRPKYFTWRIMP